MTGGVGQHLQVLRVAMRSLLPLIQKGMTGLNMTFLSFLSKNSRGLTSGAGKSGKMVQKKVSIVLIQVTVSVASQLLAIYTHVMPSPLFP